MTWHFRPEALIHGCQSLEDLLFFLSLRELTGFSWLFISRRTKNLLRGGGYAWANDRVGHPRQLLQT